MRMAGPALVHFTDVMDQVFSIHEAEVLLMKMDKDLLKYSAETNTPHKRFYDLVTKANSQGWIGALVRNVVESAGEAPEVQAFLARHPTWQQSPAPTDRYEALRVAGGAPFINRNVFRKYLRALDHPQDKKVLLVVGEKRSCGKSYSKELVSYVLQERPASVAHIDFDSVAYTPSHLVRDLARDFQMPGGLDAPSEEKHERSNGDLINWLSKAELPADNNAKWIVLDGFRERVPSEALQDFISRLADMVQKQIRFRLIVIDYKYKLDGAVRVNSLKDTPADISDDAVRSHLAAFHRERTGTEPDDSALNGYMASFQECLLKCSAEAPEYAGSLRLVNIAVSFVMRDIDNIPGVKSNAA